MILRINTCRQWYALDTHHVSDTCAYSNTPLVVKSKPTPFPPLFKNFCHTFTAQFLKKKNTKKTYNFNTSYTIDTNITAVILAFVYIWSFRWEETVVRIVPTTMAKPSHNACLVLLFAQKKLSTLRKLSFFPLDQKDTNIIGTKTILCVILSNLLELCM